MKNMGQMMQQMKKMKDQMEKAQQELETKVVVGSAGGGVVKVKMNGHKAVLGIEISSEVVDPEDVEMLQDLILAAFGEAEKQAAELINKDMGHFTAGMKIPGLF